MRIVTVLKSGGDFRPSHVYALQRQFAEYAPDATFECLTDANLPHVDTRPLKHGWPGWWAKMEMFDPALTGDFWYFDLDTVIRGSLKDFEAVRDLAMLRDFYRDGVKYREGLGSGIMFLPERDRRMVWDDFIVQPQLAMAFNRAGGDQRFLETLYLHRAARLQDLLPGQIVSWKVHCAGDVVPPDARVVAFHGQPRPWAVGQFLHLYRT